MARVKQNSFAGGAISPRMHGRTDLAKHAVSIAAGLNVYVLPEGGLTNRQGMRFAQQAKTSSTKGSRLVRFEFNSEQQYALEFGDMTLRVLRNGSYVYDASQAITGATQANPCVLTVTGHSFSSGDEVFVESVVGMTELNNRSFLVVVIDPNTFSLTDLDGNAIDSTAFTAYTSGGTVERVYELSTPYAIADLRFDPDDSAKPGLKFTQSADVMTITHPDYATYDLTRTAHNAWTLTATGFEPAQVEPTSLSVSIGTVGATTVTYTVTAVNSDTAEESLTATLATAWTITGATQADPCVLTTSVSSNLSPGDEVVITSVVGMTELNDNRYIVDSSSGTSVTLRDVDSTAFTAYTSGGSVYPAHYTITNSPIAGSENNTVSWAAVAGVTKYNVYKRRNGLFGFIGSTQALSFLDDGVLEDETDTPPTYRNPFLLEDTKPGCSTYYEQRKTYAGSTQDAQVVHLSQSAAFNNFTYSSPRKDNDAISRRLNSRQANDVRHLVTTQDLVVLTSGAEWIINPGSNSALTPTSITAQLQSNHGSSNLPPLIAGSKVLFTLPNSRVVRDFGYSTSEDRKVLYTGDDRTILAGHLFETYRLIDWCWVGDPENLLWGVREDGLLVSMAYQPDQDVWGWTEHETRGEVESITSVNETVGTVVYLLVKRTVNGITKRFIEYMQPRRYDEEPDAFFLDAGLTYDSPITITGFTNADPIVVTAPAHGLSNGDDVDIAKVRVTPDPTAGDATEDDNKLNDYRYAPINIDGWKVANVTTNTFELQNSDSTDVDGTSWRVYSSGGEVRKAVTTLTGFRHLAGHTVRALSNGNVLENVTVSSEGVITLQDPASRVHVGLGYYSEFETLELDFDDDRGTSETRRKRTPKLFMKVYRTRGLSAGPSRSKLTAIKQSLTDPYTGVLGQSIRAPWTKAGSVVVRQPYPLPMTVLMVATQPQIEDE